MLYLYSIGSSLEVLKSTARCLVRSGVRSSTRKTYTSAQKYFIDFCELHSLSPLPASETTVLLFVTVKPRYMASVDKQLLGTETAIAMRSKGISSKICGLSANDLRDAFIKAGADDFLLKPMPCKINDLKQVLERVLFEA